MTATSLQHARRTTPTLRHAFTLTELLVSIGILAILAAMTVAIVARAYRSGQHTRVKADLQAITIALGQYANDFKGAYPMTFRQDNGQPQSGEHILARALIGPGPKGSPGGSDPHLCDGLEGPGFRVSTNGKSYPPYLSPEKFQVVVVISSDGSNTYSNWELLDVFGTPIAYLPKRGKGPELVKTDEALRTTDMYDYRDLIALADGDLRDANSSQYPTKTGDPVTLKRAAHFASRTAIALGDGADANNRIGAGESLVFDGPFILISAGPDKRFVHPDDDKLPSPKADELAEDNVYSFE